MSDLITLDGGEVLDLSDYPLPEGEDDIVFNVELMAKAMDVSTVTIGKWIDQGMPVQKRGGNGQSYELRFGHCFAWRRWKEGRDHAARRTLEHRAEQKAMLFLGEEETPESARMSPKEIREWSEAELIRNKAAQQRGELVRTAHVQEMLDHLLVSLRNVITSAPDFLEQEFSLSPLQVVKAESYFDGMLIEMRKQISDGGFQPAAVVPLAREADAG
ncbi:DUF1441 family protein [Pelagimonas varians]|uniref:Phage DNA packaging protein Nu1 n=1 Tax=Pelagimonas varians TaxID=696760 RepID=A0A238JZS7_9RHOB|nr:DUF1441 family protein [Pelagimonas varians]PYG33113.1 DNA packaging protein Nu1 [Pelagimonas varians]SMX35717.1 Phage DNA packaging protein Nu1 [Pelagimonas varians]